MKEKELETQSAGYYAYAAKLDAQRRSYAESTHYTEKERITAERVKLGLELVYLSRAVYITYRKKFISIKLDSPSVRDRVGLRLLENDYTQKGYVKANTQQGITYRIPKQ